MTHLLHRIASHARMMITRGRVLKAELKPQRTVLQLSGLYNEVLSKIELFLPYGMSALPTGGEDLILLQNGNSRSHLVALFADASALRISDLQAGEFGFRDKNGRQIVFRLDHIEVTAPTGNVVVTAAAGVINLNGVTIDATGNLVSPGNITDSVRSMAADRGKYDSHKHTGVTTGSGTSGPPDTLE